MTKEQFEQKKKEIGFIEGNLKVDNVQKIFTILKEVNNIKRQFQGTILILIIYQDKN